VRVISKRKAVVAVCLLVATATAVSVALAGTTTTTKPAPPPDWLKEVAGRVAAADGDGSPATLRFALTTAQAAAPLVGLTPGDPSVEADPDRAEYVVVMTGAFEDVNSFSPSGAVVPKGTCITITVDPSTHAVRDFGLTSGAVDTSTVGAMTPFTLR